MQSECSSARRGAEALRRVLKRKFMGTEFNITVDEFAGGDTLTVAWQDGPQLADVARITAPYEHRHSHGTADLYVTRSTPTTRARGGAKFITLRRT